MAVVPTTNSSTDLHHSWVAIGSKLWPYICKHLVVTTYNVLHCTGTLEQVEQEEKQYLDGLTDSDSAAELTQVNQYVISTM